VLVHVRVGGATGERLDLAVAVAACLPGHVAALALAQGRERPQRALGLERSLGVTSAGRDEGGLPVAGLARGLAALQSQEPVGLVERGPALAFG
jgi:hypothetical protein